MQNGWMKGRVRWREALAGAAAATLLAGCGSLSGGSSYDSGPSLGDRFSQLFGGRSQAVGEAPPPPQADEPTCPSVLIRQGASTYAVGVPGQEASGTSLRYQGTITRTARDCTLSGGEVRARLGIQGRVIVGPAGAPPSVELPLRVAVVAEGVNPRTIFTSAYRTTVAVPEGDGNVSYSLVAEDIVYPVPAGSEGDSYVFYVGFDPQALKPEPRRRSKKR
ncbi:MAG: hypothetical protein WBA66_01530 [Xanthobacteraceae bacterium]